MSYVGVVMNVALLTFKTLTTDRPTYLHDLLQFRTTPRHLRSSEHRLLHVNEARTVFGIRAFSYATPTVLLIYLSDDFNTTFLSAFIGKLKTHFTEYILSSPVTVSRAGGCRV